MFHKTVKKSNGEYYFLVHPEVFILSFLVNECLQEVVNLANSTQLAEIGKIGNVRQVVVAHLTKGLKFDKQKS